MRRLGLALLLTGVVHLPAPSSSAARAAEGEPAASIQVNKETLELYAGKALVGRYHFGPEVAKPYFWPLNAPNGAAVTRGWPMVKAEPGEKTDHVHQKSAWFCHGDVIPEGMELKDKIKNVAGVDFWSEHKGHGKIVCTGVGGPGADDNHAWIMTRNEWRTADGTKILDEDRTIHLYNFGRSYLIVLDIEFQASVCPITFGDTKEGSLGVRVRDSMTEKKGEGKLTNADGAVGEKNLWGRQSKWCDYSGPVKTPSGGRTATVGVAIFDHPDNKYPSAWHSRGYGLMAANPFGRNRSGFPALKGKTDLVKLGKGERLKLRYGILLHNGDVKEGKVAETYEKFTKLKGS